MILNHDIILGDLEVSGQYAFLALTVVFIIFAVLSVLWSLFITISTATESCSIDCVCLRILVGQCSVKMLRFGHCQSEFSEDPFMD